MSEKIATYPPAGKDVFLRHDLDPRVVAAENEEIGKQRTHKGMSAAGPKVGLAFSGGGIRSATFGLGVLEALKESKVLPQVDYLSTVSGGGYIGSWLTTNCLRNGGWGWTAKEELWDTSIRHLRKYSNYLSPQLGFFSADSWSIATIWIRNTMLIQTTIILALIVLFLLPQLSIELFVKWPGLVHYRFVTFLLFGLGVVGAAGNLLGMQREECWVLQGENWNASALMGGGPLALGIFAYLKWQGGWWIEVLIAFSLLLGMFLLLPMAVKLYAVGQRWAGVEVEKRAARIRYGQSLTQLLLVVPMMIAAYLIASVMCYQAYWIFEPESAYSRILETAMENWWLPFSFAVLTFLMLSLCLLKKGAGAKGLWGVTLAVVAASGVLYLLLCAIIYAAQALIAKWPDAADWHCQILLPALVLYAFSLGVVAMIGMVGNASTEGAREWWSRMGAWLGIYGFAWTLLAAFSIYVPWAVTCISSLKVWSGLGGIVGTTLTGLWAGGSKSTGQAEGEGKKVNWPLEIIARVAPFVFIVGLLGGTATLLYYVELQAGGGESGEYWKQLHAIAGYPVMEFFGYPLYLLPTILVTAIVLTLGFASRVDLNEFSLNAFYRNRLSRCYLGASRLDAGESSEADKKGTARKPHPFTGFDDDDDVSLKALRFDHGFYGPLHIVNCALNLGGAGDLSVQSRKAANFQFSALHCGSNRPLVRLADTPAYSGDEERAEPTLGQVVSVSGAAASPNMGYHSSTPAAFLLTMFNVRLGWWFGNPSRDCKGDRAPGFSLRYLAVELLAMATQDSNYLMVSDGGHFENLAVYELVRRKTGLILCSDGEADGKYGFEGLGRLIRICRVDFDARIEIDLGSIRPDALTRTSRSHCAVGRIYYADGSRGWLVYIKASYKGAEDEAMQQYRSANPAFPHECTGDQFYSEDQFESYRTLGRLAGREAFSHYESGDLREFVASHLAATLSPDLDKETAFTRHTARLNDLYARLGKEEGLQGIAGQFSEGLGAGNEGSGVEGKSQRHYFCMEALQLMEDVFVDLDLGNHMAHTDVQGWIHSFGHWVESQALKEVWEANRDCFGVRFACFIEVLQGMKPKSL